MIKFLFLLNSIGWQRGERERRYGMERGLEVTLFLTEKITGVGLALKVLELLRVGQIEFCAGEKWTVRGKAFHRARIRESTKQPIEKKNNNSLRAQISPPQALNQKKYARAAKGCRTVPFRTHKK